VVFAGAGVKTNKKQPREMVFAVPGIKKNTSESVCCWCWFQKKTNKKQPATTVFAVPGIKRQ
jgi:hypothetical protein